MGDGVREALQRLLLSVDRRLIGKDRQRDLSDPGPGVAVGQIPDVPPDPYLYLESGLYDITNLTDGDPAVWAIGDAIKNQANGVLGAWKRTTPPSGSVDPESLPIDSAVTLSAADKLCQLTAPASIYSGKLRAYVQAIYGSGLVGYSLNGRNISVNGLTFSAYGSSGSALYVHKITETDPQDPQAQWEYSDYYFLAITTTSVTVYPLDLADPLYGPSLDRVFDAYKVLPADSDLRPVYEGFLLSLFRPDGPAVETVSISIPEADGIPIGSPIYYGWQSTSDGHEVSQVFVNYEPWTGHCRGQRVVLAIAYDDQQPAGSQWSVDVSVLGLVDGIPSRHQLGWLPDDSLGGSWLMFYPCTTGDPTNIPGASNSFSNLLVSGWYDEADTWQPISFSRAYTASQGPYDDGSHSYSVCGYQSNTDVRNSRTGTGEIDTVSVRVGGATYSVTIDPVGTKRSILESNFSQTGSQPCRPRGWTSENSPTPCNAGDVPAHGPYTVFGILDYEGKKTQYKTVYSAPTITSGTVAFVIPRNDCSSAIALRDSRVPNSVAISGNAPRTVQFLRGSSGINYRPLVLDIYDIWWIDAYTPGGCTGEVLATGILRPHSRIDLGAAISGSWNGGGSVEATLALSGGTRELGSSATGNTLDVGFSAEQIESLATYDPLFFIQKVLLSGGGLSADWAAFLDAPEGICSVGNRNLDLSPRVLESAIFGDSVAPVGSSVYAQVPDGGYVSGTGFVGYA